MTFFTRIFYTHKHTTHNYTHLIINRIFISISISEGGDDHAVCVFLLPFPFPSHSPPPSPSPSPSPYGYHLLIGGSLPCHCLFLPATFLFKWSVQSQATYSNLDLLKHFVDFVDIRSLLLLISSGSLSGGVGSHFLFVLPHASCLSFQC